MAEGTLVNADRLVSVTEGQELLHQGSLFLDVRPSSSGHDPHEGDHHNHNHPPNPTGAISGSVIVDKRRIDELLQPDSELTSLLEQNRDKGIVVYCNSDHGSDPVVTALAARGYDVRHIEGGFRAWVSENGPVVDA